MKTLDGIESTQYDGAINEYLDANQDNQFNLETTAIAASRVFSIPQKATALEMAKNNPAFIKMWDVFQKSTALQKATIDQIIEVQKASHSFIQLINKRGMLEAAAIITIKNQLISLNIENKQINETIKKLAGNVLERFNALEKKLVHVEAVASLTQWIQNLKWRKYDQDRHTKRYFRILEDFYLNSAKSFTLQNLESLKTALDLSAIDPFAPITITEFTTKLIDELVDNDFNESLEHSPYDNKNSFDDVNSKIALPFLSSIYLIAEEYNHLTKRRYPINKIRDDIKQAVLCYMKKDCGIDIDASLEYYHLGIELLNGRRLAEFLASPVPADKNKSAAVTDASPVKIDESKEGYQEYRKMVQGFFQDVDSPGTIDTEEREILNLLKKKLKLTDEEATRIEEAVADMHKNKAQAAEKYREEVRKALGENTEITAKKRMRLDLTAEACGIDKNTAQSCESEVIAQIEQAQISKVEQYREIFREKLSETGTLTSKARMFMDLKCEELGLSNELAEKCETEELTYKNDNLDNGTWIGTFQEDVLDLQGKYLKVDFSINFRTDASGIVTGDIVEERNLKFSSDTYTTSVHSIITKGYHDKKNRQIRFTKKYDYDGHIVNYKGEFGSEDAISGSWNVGSNTGVWQATRRK